MDGIKLDGSLLGAASGALWWLSQDNQDRDERLRSVQLDNRSLSNRLNSLTGSADWVRLTSPAVRDASVGIAAATPTAAAAQTVPPIANAATRPDLSGGANITQMQWPPSVGQYDAAGRTAGPGELSLAAYALTYQESRAWTQGLAQSQAPTGEQVQQLFYAAQGLSGAAMGMRRSAGEWQAVWKSLLATRATGMDGESGAAMQMDPHLDPAKSPSIVAVAAARVIALNDPAAGAPPPAMNNPQTDATNRWRIQCGAAGHGAGERLARVTFRTEYFVRTTGGAKSFQPVVVTNRPQIVYADNVTSTGFDLIAGSALGGGVMVDVAVAVSAGVGAEQLIG